MDHILAEKVRALMVRGKVRDLYDIWFIIESGVELDIKLINEKLALYKKTFDVEEFRDRVSKMKKDWERDLKPLVGTFLSYDLLTKKIIETFEKAVDQGLS